MKIRLITVSQKMPDWVEAPSTDYQKRLPKDYALEFVSIPAQKHNKGISREQIMRKEAEKIRSKLLDDERLIILERKGQQLSTIQLANKLKQWHDQSQSIAIIIGGAWGVDPELLRMAHQQWSISQMTFPHPMVKLMISEQIYRAYSIIIDHPYHR